MADLLFNYNGHPHLMKFLRPDNKSDGSKYSCGNCKEEIKVEHNSFPRYCSKCNFAVCELCFCLKNFKKINSPSHDDHFLFELSLPYEKSGWSCNICKSSFKAQERTLHCAIDHFDLCMGCRKSESKMLHEHFLKQTLQNKGFTCNICRRYFDSSTISRFCAQDNFSVCPSCFDPNNNNNNNNNNDDDENHTKQKEITIWRILDNKPFNITWKLTKFLGEGVLKKCYKIEHNNCNLGLLVIKTGITSIRLEITSFVLALKIISVFNEQIKHLNKVVSCNQYYISKEDPKILFEDFLNGQFQKFNSNCGDVISSQTMQALSHFSFHASECVFLFCDLQGIVKQNGKFIEFILSDFTFHSKDGNMGGTDLGQEGIITFFLTHKCNPVCQLLKLPDITLAPGLSVFKQNPYPTIIRK